MSRIIREISTDIKSKMKYADRDIHKAIEKKMDYPMLADKYYEFSMNAVDDIMDLHNVVVDLIKEYRTTNGEPPKEMLVLWDNEHKGLLEDVAEIKILQNYYKSL